MINDKKVVIIMPAYNAEKTLKQTYDEIYKPFVDEVILVDDNSQDNTKLVSKELNITTIVHKENKGYGGNQKSCYKAALKAGADIVVGDVQTLGLPMSFGGPHAGFMACKEKYVRQLPGRLAGRTVDAEGNQAFTLTIQTREQHIKREKATSNICSNQALIGLCANLYLSLMGEKGFKQAGFLSAKMAHLLSQKLAEFKGIKTLNNNFFNEFVIEVNDADEFLAKLKKAGIIGGLKLDKNRILVAATEMISEDDIDLYIASI